MDSIPKSIELTTDEGNDKQPIYETTSLPSINKINSQIILTSLKPSSSLEKYCSNSMYSKYSRVNLKFMLDPINKKAKKIYLNNFKEMITWKKASNNIKKYHRSFILF